MKANDADLVRKCRQGDRGAFEALVDKYQKPLFNAAYRIVGDYDDARDVTQTAFLKAYGALDRYDPSYKFYSWIYRIALNEALNVAGRRAPVEPLSPAEPAPGPSPEQSATRVEIGDRVQRALDRLTPDHRAVIVLRHFLEYTYEEIASALELPAKTVKSRLFTARRRLRDVLESLDACDDRREELPQ